MSETGQATLLGALVEDYTGAKLAPADRAMLDYAVKLTMTPSEIEAHDVDRLRGEGFNDAGIHDICAISAYFAFVNRIANGLGVELEENRSFER